MTTIKGERQVKEVFHIVIQIKRKKKRIRFTEDVTGDKKKNM